jgi:hypothetical protein
MMVRYMERLEQDPGGPGYIFNSGVERHLIGS